MSTEVARDSGRALQHGLREWKRQRGVKIPPFPLFFGLSVPQPPGSPPPAEVVIGAEAAGSPGAQSAGERILPSNRRSCSSRREGRAPPASLFSLASLHLAQDASAVIGSAGCSRVTIAPGPTRRSTEIRKYQRDVGNEGGSHVVACELYELLTPNNTLRSLRPEPGCTPPPGPRLAVGSTRVGRSG